MSRLVFFKLPAETEPFFDGALGLESRWLQLL